MSSFKYFLLIFPFILWANMPIYAKRPFTIEILEIKLNVSDADFFKIFTYSLTNKKRGSMNILFGQNVTDFTAQLSFDILTKGNRRIHLLKTEVDVCEMLKEQASPNNFISIVWNEVLRASNLPRRCPLIENVLYTLKNYTVNDESYPSILPVSYWQYDLHIVVNKIYISDMTVRGRIRKV